MRTTKFNVQEIYAVPTNLNDVLCMVLRTNNDYFPVQNRPTGFITMTECVYCAVRTESVTVIQIHLTLYRVKRRLSEKLYVCACVLM